MVTTEQKLDFAGRDEQTTKSILLGLDPDKELTQVAFVLTKKMREVDGKQQHESRLIPMSWENEAGKAGMIAALHAYIKAQDGVALVLVLDARFKSMPNDAQSEEYLNNYEPGQLTDDESNPEALVIVACGERMIPWVRITPYRRGMDGKVVKFDEPVVNGYQNGNFESRFIPQFWKQEAPKHA